MHNYLIFISFFALSSFAFSQKYYVQIQEENTFINLPFFNVFSENGTHFRTNINGILEINSIQEICIQKNIGYKDTCLTFIPQKDTTIILLRHQVYDLQEVIIYKKSIKEILINALDSIETHFLNQTTTFTAFHREQLIENKQTIFISEGLYHICKAPYLKKPKADQVQLLEGYKKLYPMESDIQKYAENIGSAYIMFLNDFAKFAPAFIEDEKNILDEYTFEYAGSDTTFSRNLLCIAFYPVEKKKSKGIFEGKIYLDARSLSIVKIDYHISKKGIEIINDFDWKAKILMKVMGIKISFSQFSTSLIYQKHSISNKYYLQKAQIYIEGNYKRKRKGFNVFLQLYSDMIVFEEEKKGICPIPIEKRLTWNSNLLQLLKDAEYEIPTNLSIEKAYEYYKKKHP